ncbi:hypothetical protein NHX12_009630 [Muraenolepis orangiensis]|uniref:Neuronal tyrosine-phosphorylated phosphoinositide-3-kinase adapter 1 n=1 Tax=Muraenolepis orangiensis TaxID=630683 RepID=A0A9Q0I9P1_9TELE|nr:hypothetical protein NHX12_009630 [Muraenolepis orangiensis]
MSSGSAQDAAVEHFLRDIERRGKRLHCAVIGRGGEERPHGDMNLLYRKSRLDWRQREQQEASKKSAAQQNDPSATVGKGGRDLASFRRHFRMGFMTMPASQDLSPHSCASAMAPRSQSCHAVGAGDAGLESEDYSDTQSQHGARCPPGKHSEKKNGMKKSDSGDVGGKKVPPLKPKRSPNTQLTFETPPPRQPSSAGSSSFQAADSQRGDSDDEPVYIEMVGKVFTRESQTATPHPVTPVATTPDSDSDQSEAIYEEMKYLLQEDRGASQRRVPTKHEKLKSSKHYRAKASTSNASPVPRATSTSPSCSKAKAMVSISHSTPLPSSASSTPVPQVLSSSPHTPRAPTPYLLPGSKSETESGTKIPAPFPNLLQHRPPLLAFPQPAAASSGVGVQQKASASAKQGTQSSGTSTQESSGTGSSHQDKHGRDAQLGPAPGLRARSHSTPLPPSSKSTSPSQTSQGSSSSTPTPLRPHSRPHLRSHTSHGLPAYKPPSSDSPLLWTYPSVGFRRPPAYESLRGPSSMPPLHQASGGSGGGEGSSKGNGGSGSLPAKAGFMPWDSGAGLAFGDEGYYWPMQRKLSSSASRSLGYGDSLGGGKEAGQGFRALLPRAGHPLPCQTFPACRNGEVGRLGRSSSSSGVRQSSGGDVQRQSSLPAREALNQVHALAKPRAPGSPGLSRQQQQFHLHQHLQQLQQQHHLQLQFQHLAQLAQGQPSASGGGPQSAAAQTQRDGKLLEVIERKRCLCKEIKAHRRPDKSLCKQDSMPILPSWRRTPEPRKTGTPPCQRPPAVVWDTAI